MKKSILGALLATALLSQHGVMAASSMPATTTKVCVVQIAQVLHQSPKIKKDVENLKNKFDKDQKALKAAQEDLDKSTKEFNKNEMVMSVTDKAQASKALETERSALLEKINAFQSKLNAEQKAMMDIVFKQLNTIIQAQAQAAQCDVVLDSQFVLWANTKWDITAAVAKAFDAEKVNK